MLIPDGFLIVFEGIGGSGKSTVAARLADALEQDGWVLARTREPGGTELGDRLRSLLLGRQDEVDFWCEAFLFEADRAQTFTYVLAPALKAGQVVVSDRGPFGTIAYQGFGRGLDQELIQAMSSVAWRGRQANLVFVVDVDPSVGLSRKLGATERDRFDEEGLAFQQRVREGYLAAAGQFGPGAIVLNGERSREDVFQEAWKTTRERLNEAAGLAARRGGRLE